MSHQLLWQKLQGLSKNELGLPACVQASTFFLDAIDSFEPPNHSNSEVTITFVQSENTELLELFVDGNDIPQKDWHINDTCDQVFWSTHSHDLQLEGVISLAEEQSIATLRIGNQQFSASMRPIVARYYVDVSKNSGAKLGADGLEWDDKSEHWKNGAWLDQTLEWTYSVVEVGVIAGQVIRGIRMEFTDLRTKEKWVIDPYMVDARLDSKMNFVVQLKPGFDPPISDSTHTNIFPYLLQFALDPTATKFTGAALVSSPSDFGTPNVLGIRGHAVNSAIVGTYIFEEEGNPIEMRVSPKGLLIDNTLTKDAKILGDRVSWSALQNKSETKCIPDKGYFECSKDGRHILDSSLHSTQKKTHADSTEDHSKLSVYDLIGLDPHSKKVDGTYEDQVQTRTTEDFYRLIQSYIPEDLRTSFISANPIDIRDIQHVRNAANSNKKTREWYGKLAIPFLASSLSTNIAPEAKKINGRRARTRMQELLVGRDQKDNHYKQQSEMLYRHHWISKFPITKQFLEDQVGRREHYDSIIKEDADKWRSESSDSNQSILYGSDEDEISSRLKEIDEIEERAIGGKYWAYALFRFVTSSHYINHLRMQKFSGAGQYVTTTKRLVSVFTILDDSQFFAQKFAEFLDVFWLTLAVDYFDPKENENDLRLYLRDTLKQFLLKYIQSSDPAIAEHLSEVQKDIAEKYNGDHKAFINESVDMYIAALATAASSIHTPSWTRLVDRYRRGIRTKLGTAMRGISVVSDLAMIGVAVYSINQLLGGGSNSYGSTDARGRAYLVSSGVGVIANYASKFAERGASLKFMFNLKTKPKIWKTYYFISGSQGKYIASQRLGNGLRGWLSAGTQHLSVQNSFGARFVQAHPKVAKVFGRNLNNFMATRVSVGLGVTFLVLHSIDLHNSKNADEKAAHGTLLASSIFQVSAGIALMAGYTTAAAILGSISIVGAVAGLVVLFVLESKRKEPTPPPSPLENFINDTAEPAGFKMDMNYDIDDFDQTTVALELVQHDVRRHSEKKIYLDIDANGELRISQEEIPSTVFYVNVDGLGRVLFRANHVIRTENQTPEGIELVLQLDDKGQFSVQPYDPTEAYSPKNLCQLSPRGNDERNPDGTVASAQFTIRSLKESEGASTFLGSSGGMVTAGNSAFAWRVTRHDTKLAGLSMGDIRLESHVNSLREFRPFLARTSESQLKWSIYPDLPSGLSLDQDTGTLKQSGVIKRAMSAEFTLSASAGESTVSTQFTIAISDADESEVLLKQEI